MAANTTKKYPLGSPQEQIKMCEIHGKTIDMICEDCDEFICVECAITGHREHDPKTLPTAATQRRRCLVNFLKKIKEEDLPRIDEKIEKIPQQITENIELCDSEIKKLRMHYDEIIARLTDIKKRHEQTLRDSLVKKKDQLNHVKSELDKKKRGIVETVEFMEENNSTMSDYSLIDNHRELTKMLSKMKVHMTNCEHSARFNRGDINDDLLESLVGKTFDLGNNEVTQINSFQYRDKPIYVLKAYDEDQCYIREYKSLYTEKVNKEGEREHEFSIIPYDMCMTDTGDVYFTDLGNKSIRCLSPSGSVSTVISTDPLAPIGICHSLDGGLLVTLRDNESDCYELESHSRSLVRHIKVTGDVIHEYEYQEDGQTRLFTVPHRVTQNSNSDICVVNLTSDTTGELVIMSPSGRMKSVYRGQNLKENFKPTDVVCDSLCNILVTDPPNNQIHLLSPDKELLKFLLTGNEVNHPCRLSLYKSTLWVGYREGLVKVFQYRL
ncbi:uncharacterized protein LOC133174793 [Saccostrea echinata]|uniref:uncharacterized protein LOC133174793 n=1 Tax=Saccostrea echinata TaxID=191078 RepID=UPI002A80C95B|nr:uncharacterized protein LOC133174793 [Saccostrea echinata]